MAPDGTPANQTDSLSRLEENVMIRGSRVRRWASAMVLIGIGAIAAATGTVQAATAPSAVGSIAANGSVGCNDFTCENHNQVLL